MHAAHRPPAAPHPLLAERAAPRRCPRLRRAARHRRAWAGAAAAVVALCLPAPAAAAGGVSIFKLGDYVDQKPFEVMVMYFVCFAATILYESIVHHVDQMVTTHSGKNIVHHVYSEIMILGGISALLTVFENLGGSALFEAVLFHYVHFVIFCMAVFFITLVGSLFVFIESSWKQWARFEYNIITLETDPSLTQEDQHAFLMQYLRQGKGSSSWQMISAILFFRSCLPPGCERLTFCRYMKKMQRKRLLSFLDLHGSTWLMLGILCTAGAVVTHITLIVSDLPEATISLWVLFVGYGPLIVLAVIYFKIRKEFLAFTRNVQEMMQSGAEMPAQRSHFWFGSPSKLTFLMQTMLVYQVFYLANATINFVYRLWQLKGGTFMILACYVPTLFCFFVMIPVSMPPLTILASLGDFMDHEVVHRMREADATGGKWRRQRLRDRQIAEPAAFLEDTMQDSVVVFQRGKHHAEEGTNSQGSESASLAHGHESGHGGGHDGHGAERMLLTDEGMLPLPRPGHGHAHHGHGHSKLPDVICEECHKTPAAWTCGICGILCGSCNTTYHSLRRFRDHHQIRLKVSAKLFTPDSQLRTDNPIINKAFTADTLYKKVGTEAEALEAARDGVRSRMRAKAAHDAHGGH
eukprot:TRINITY_DN1574_c0_g1_i1.p1 TRINITY_DN1574_c0_g1~~TRINITY_DN1574_c0_g1_i1.p1  ORF type:complete len:662 (+),score=223.73 TRINITY_DN1574_c0_g1_i1:84-1988(+)